MRLGAPGAKTKSGYFAITFCETAISSSFAIR